MTGASPRLRPRPAAFTLVEVLVSLTVIAILMAIALPVMGGAIEAGRRTVCLNNLRWLHEGVAAYMRDHRDELPFASRSYSLYVDYSQPLETLAPYFDVAIPHKNTDGVITTGQPWVCPSDRDFATRHGANYLYFPYERMGILGSADGVSLMYRSNPRWCLWRDSRSPHPGGPAHRITQEPVHIQGVAYDGAAGWYAEVIRTN